MKQAAKEVTGHEQRWRQNDWYDDEWNITVVEGNKPSIKMMQRDMNAKAKKTESREKQGGNQETKKGSSFWNVFMIRVK
jgi:hypothetical protein